MNEMETNRVLNQVEEELRRQEQLVEEGKIEGTCAQLFSDFERLPVLMEEVGEVGRALLEKENLVHDQKGSDLRTELIQVAAVAISWASVLDTE